MACSMMLAPNVSLSSCVCSSTSPSVARIPLRNRGCVRASASNDSVQVQQQPKDTGVSQVRQRPPQQNVMRKPVSPLSTQDMWDPFMPASRTFNQMLDLMNQVMESGPAPTTTTPSIQRRGSGRLPWDVMEDEENFMMRIDMPGLSKDEVKVSIVDDGFLLIKGETSEERKKGDKWAARSVGTYETRVMVPDNVELEKIRAELREGVLYVTVPKKKVEERKPVEIQVS